MDDSPATAEAPTPEEAAAPSPAMAIVAGLALMAGALGLDVVAHGRSLSALEPVPHVAGVLGMAITWLAVVLDGANHRVRPR